MKRDDLPWSASEKKIARSAFDAALESALAKTMAEFKKKAAAVAAPSEMWDIEDFLHRQRRALDETFDYRYAQLPLVFARLIRAGYLDEGRLTGLSKEKLMIIRSLVSSLARS
jgi:hypothetical protein